MSEQKIPKIIHYCWFGGKPLPDLVQKRIASWKNFCPDYEIKEWNESNYNVRKIPYTAQAYDAQKYAFVSDYARLDIIYEYGGIYLDVDVELAKPLDDLLNLKGFAGFDQGGHCNFGEGFGAIPHHPLIKEFLDYYDHLSFILDNGNFNQTPCPVYQTNVLLTKGLILDNTLQEIDGITIFPPEYFDPKDFYSGEIHLTKNTHSIHHYDASWTDSGPGLIKKELLNSWGLILASNEEQMYYKILRGNYSIQNKQDLNLAIEIMEKIFAAGKNHCKNDTLLKVIKSYIKQITENALQNKAASIKLYFTTFRKWEIFETRRAKLRYIYHCVRNLLHV